MHRLTVDIINTNQVEQVIHDNQFQNIAFFTKSRRQIILNNSFDRINKDCKFFDKMTTE